MEQQLTAHPDAPRNPRGVFFFPGILKLFCVKPRPDGGGGYGQRNCVHGEQGEQYGHGFLSFNSLSSEL